MLKIEDRISFTSRPLSYCRDCGQHIAAGHTDFPGMCSDCALSLRQRRQRLSRPYEALIQELQDIERLVIAERCRDCGAKLKPDEKTYLGNQCDACATDLCERVTAWRMGAPDPELDRRFGIEQTTIGHA